MANITRWNPVREMITLRETMDQMFNDNFSRGTNGRTAHLPIDAYVTENAIVLVTDVPGLKPEEIAITMEKDTLTIRGEYKTAEADRQYLLRERPVGKFERTMTINTPIDADRVEATFENGTLILTLPKAEAAKPKQISIRSTVTSNN